MKRLSLVKSVSQKVVYLTLAASEIQDLVEDSIIDLLFNYVKFITIQKRYDARQKNYTVKGWPRGSGIYINTIVAFFN